MFDRRNLTSGGVGSPIHKFEGHTAAVLCVQVHEILCRLFQLFIIGLFLSIAFFMIFICSVLLVFQWSPDKSSVFGSSAEDGLLNIWDHEKVWSHSFCYCQSGNQEFWWIKIGYEQCIFLFGSVFWWMWLGFLCEFVLYHTNFGIQDVLLLICF